MTRTSRALIASRVFEPEGSAAAYRLGALARSLERAGYRVTVLTTRSSVDASSTSRVRRWPVLRDKSGAVRGYLQYASFDIPLFFRLLFSPRADVVIAEP
ncbi:MAG TPA: glycosyltransferase, partial [Terrimesophilobacter sp.]